METLLSTKGQIVLPQTVRRKLALQPGDRLICRVENGTILLTPAKPAPGKTRRVTDPLTGLAVTEAAPGIEPVTSEQVRAALIDFP